MCIIIVFQFLSSFLLLDSNNNFCQCTPIFKKVILYFVLAFPNTACELNVLCGHISYNNFEYSHSVFHFFLCLPCKVP